MNKEEAVLFLFSIAREIKRSLEHPVILLTMTDYADCIFNSLVNMRSALLQNASPKNVLEIINNFHLGWLQAIQDVENFKKRLRDTPRDTIIKAIEFTNECAKNRCKYFWRYITRLEFTMTPEEYKLMKADLEDIEDLSQTLYSVLSEKYKCMRGQADQDEFFVKVSDEIDELMNWLDTLNNNLAIQFSKVVGLNFSALTSELTKTLHQIIDEVAMSASSENREKVKEFQNKDQRLSSILHLSISDELETRKIIEKKKHLEDRIERLRDQNSSAVMALEHKTKYLEERLTSLENLKLSLCALKNKSIVHKEDQKFENREQKIHMFDHLLPPQTRCRLVQELMTVWAENLCGTNEKKSIISILSVTDLKEVFSDELGTFTVDKYGRKIYQKLENDVLYQANERNELVPLKDDERHVYFYDKCGRYYLNDEQRVYKAPYSSSEYLITRDGLMAKIREIKDGVEYFYDSMGRYRRNLYGKHIYVDRSGDEYESDSLGNLVRIRNEENMYELCSNEPGFIEECMYLKREVGEALKKCIAKVVLNQPPDPILFLANSLQKYHYNIVEGQKRREEEVELVAERKIRMLEEHVSAHSFDSAGEEETPNAFIDLNFANYHTIAPE